MLRNIYANLHIVIIQYKQIKTQLIFANFYRFISENFKYKMGGEEFASKETEVSNGAEVAFSLVLDEGYGGPVVKAGDSELSVNNGEYKFTVNSDNRKIQRIPYLYRGR